MAEPETLIPKHGGYRKLKSFQVAQLVYDVTVRFCDRYIDPRSRTHDQMVQAARSGVQNIAEGSQASGTSKKMELKLTNVARASLEELRLDYEDFLRQRGLPLWAPDDPRRQELIDAAAAPPAEDVAAWVRRCMTRRPVDGRVDRMDQGSLRQPSGAVHQRPCRPRVQSHLPRDRGQRRAGADGRGRVPPGPPDRRPGRGLRAGGRLHRAALPRPQSREEGQT